MPLIDDTNYESPNHLACIFSSPQMVYIGSGELERLKAIEREVYQIKNTIAEQPLTTVLVAGTALETLMNLL